MSTEEIMDVSLENLESNLNSSNLISDPIEEQIVYVKKIDSFGRSYATGKRKNAIARVWVKAGKGSIIVNGRNCDKFFARPVLRMVLEQPLVALEKKGQFDIANAHGGGISGQVGAIRLGIARALVSANEEDRKALRGADLLTRDPRCVERKKYGRAEST